MKYRFLFIISFIFFSSCRENKNSDNTSDIVDTSSATLKKDLLGKWGFDKEPVIEIKTDSIYYFQKDSTYSYQLRGDTFMVRFSPSETFTIWGKLSIVGDTLKITDYNMNNFVTYGYRIR